VPVPVPCPAVPWQCHPLAQGQLLWFPAGHFSPGTANSAKGFQSRAARKPGPGRLLARARHPSGKGAAGKGHQAGDRALSLGSLGQAKAAGVQPLPRRQRCGGEQSPQIVLRWPRYWYGNFLHQSLTAHGSLPLVQLLGAAWGSSIAQGQALSFPAGWGLERGAVPSLGLHPQRHPRAAGCLAASQHPRLMAAARLVEVVVWALGGLARSDVSRWDLCLLPGVALGGSPVSLDPTPPTQRSCGSDIPARPLLLHTRQRAREGSPSWGKQQET